MLRRARSGPLLGCAKGKTVCDRLRAFGAKAARRLAFVVVASSLALSRSEYSCGVSHSTLGHVRPFCQHGSGAHLWTNSCGCGRVCVLVPWYCSSKARHHLATLAYAGRRTCVVLNVRWSALHEQLDEQFVCVYSLISLRSRGQRPAPLNEWRALCRSVRSCAAEVGFCRQGFLQDPDPLGRQHCWEHFGEGQPHRSEAQTQKREPAGCSDNVDDVDQRGWHGLPAAGEELRRARVHRGRRG